MTSQTPKASADFEHVLLWTLIALEIINKMASFGMIHSHWSGFLFFLGSELLTFAFALGVLRRSQTAKVLFTLMMVLSGGGTLIVFGLGSSAEAGTPDASKYTLVAVLALVQLTLAFAFALSRTPDERA